MLLELKNISRRYYIGETIQALDNVSLLVKKGEFVAIKGPSGCGKSTLLNIIGLLDVPDEGEYQINGRPTEKMSSKARASLRNREFGFVFQSFNLLPRTSAYDNVLLPLKYRREKIIKPKVLKVLGEVGLENRKNSKPNQLSGGQQQRVAIARAMVGDPEIILADEPTGNLDSKTSLEIFEVFRRIHKKGKTIIFVTHNDELLTYASRVIVMRDGRILEDITK